MATPKKPPDQWLVEQCLKGDQKAWNELVARYRTPLLAFVRRSLQRLGQPNGNAADEILTRIWFALVKDDRRQLRRYDASRGSLWQYLLALARSRLAQHCRRWQRWARDRDRSNPDTVPDPDRIGGQDWGHGSFCLTE